MYNRKLIITEEEKKNILSLHENTRRKEFGLITEGYDQNTKTYSTDAALVMYGDLYNSGSAKTIKGAYVFKFPMGSKATMYSSNNPVSKGVSLSGQMTKPDAKSVNVSLDCNKNSFTYYDAGSTKTITLYNTGLESFVTKMKNIFCLGKIPGNDVGGGGKAPGTTPTIDQVKNCANRLSFRQGMRGEEIKKVQGLLGTKYSNILGTGDQTKIYDGIFGSKTTSAVKQFQTDNGLKSDGIVGCNTMNKMLEILKSSVQIEKPASKPNPDLALGDQSSAVNLTQGNQNPIAGL